MKKRVMLRHQATGSEPFQNCPDFGDGGGLCQGAEGCTGFPRREAAGTGGRQRLDGGTAGKEQTPYPGVSSTAVDDPLL